MPPKKQGPSKKAEVKKQDKIIEDKTFGLKNKKGAKKSEIYSTSAAPSKNWKSKCEKD